MARSRSSATSIWLRPRAMYLSCVMDTFVCPRWSAPIRADLIPHLPPLLVEVVRVPPGARRRRKDHLLFTEKREPATLRECVDRKPRQWQGPLSGRALRVVDTHQPVAGCPNHLPGYGHSAGVG